jgi:hypothetical protein
VPTEPSRARRPAPEPLDADAVRPVAVGTVLWFAAFLVLLPFHRRLSDAGHELWLWTSLVGGGLGLLGLPLCLRQRASTRRARTQPPADQPPDPRAVPQPDPPAR